MICENRNARRRFELLHCYEAGLVLEGSEVKACRSGAVQLNQAYVKVIGHQVFLVGAHIGSYSFASFAHIPDRNRKLLLHRREIAKISQFLTQKGFTAVPLKMYFSPRGLVKLEFWLARGKSDVDKRATIKEREVDRDIARLVRYRQRSSTH